MPPVLHWAVCPSGFVADSGGILLSPRELLLELAYRSLGRTFDLKYSAIGTVCKKCRLIALECINRGGLRRRRCPGLEGIPLRKMRSGISEPSPIRRNSVSPPKTVVKLMAPMKVPDEEGHMKQSIERLREVAVLGKVDGPKPEKTQLQNFVHQITGKAAVRIRFIKDESFVITCATKEDAQKLIATRELFNDLPIHLEAWEQQKSTDRRVFKTRLLKVKLVDNREECIDMAERLVVRLRELYIAPSKEDLWGDDEKACFLVKVADINRLPSGLDRKVFDTRFHLVHTV